MRELECLCAKGASCAVRAEAWPYCVAWADSFDICLSRMRQLPGCMRKWISLVGRPIRHMRMRMPQGRREAALFCATERRAIEEDIASAHARLMDTALPPVASPAASPTSVVLGSTPSGAEDRDSLALLHHRG